MAKSATKPTPEATTLPVEPERYIDLHEAAAFLGMTSRALYLRLYGGQKIPCTKIGRLYRFQKSALAVWANNNPGLLRQNKIASSRPKKGKGATP